MKHDHPTTTPMASAANPRKRRTRALIISALILVFFGGGLLNFYLLSKRNQRDAALWDAVERGDVSGVTYFLDQGANPDINEYDILDRRHGMSARAVLTRLAGREPKYNIDPKTSTYTADPSVGGNWTKRQKWNTALWLATDQNQPEIVRILLARGAKDNATGYLDTALMWAAERGHIDIVKSALASGSDVNAHDDFGYTALDGAAMLGHIDIVELLLQHGADPRETASAAAKRRGDTKMFEMIERARAAKPAANRPDQTAQ
jgi:hypothetical protein